MKIKLFTFSFLACFNLSAQFNHIDYKKACSSAYSLAIDSLDYQACLTKLSKIEKQYDQLYCEEFILMAYCYKKKGEDTKSAKCLKKAWSTYAFDLECLSQIPQISLTYIHEGFSKKEQKLVQQGYHHFAKLKRSNTDSLKTVFEAMLERDQEPRMKFYTDSVIDTIAVNKEIRQADSLNLMEFRNIIYKMGYPGEWILPGNVSRVFVLLVHSAYDQTFFDEMKPIFLKEVIEGRMPPSYYAVWLDKHAVFINSTMDYGMLKIPGRTNFTQDQITDIQTRRLNIGLIKNCPIPTKMLSF